MAFFDPGHKLDLIRRSSGLCLIAAVRNPLAKEPSHKSARLTEFLGARELLMVTEERKGVSCDHTYMVLTHYKWAMQGISNIAEVLTMFATKRRSSDRQRWVQCSKNAKLLWVPSPKQILRRFAGMLLNVSPQYVVKPLMRMKKNTAKG